jgi:Flagellar hook-length control protein FliK
VQSQVPLQAGQTLQLAVSQATDGSIALAVVGQQGGVPTSQGPADSQGATATADTVTLAPDAAAAIAPQATPAASAQRAVLTPLEAAAVSVAVQSAAAQQTSLAQLFANLGVAAGLDSLPPQVQQAVVQLLAQRTPLDAGLTGNDINQAFQNSGLFLEASLASGLLSQSAATPDLKAALIILRQVLSTSLSAAPAAQGALVTQGALPTQSALAGVSQPVAAPAAAVPAATTASVAAQQIVTAAAGVPVSAGAVPLAVTSAATAVVQQATATAVLQAGVQPVQLLVQPVTITAESATLTAASPTLAPQLASETAAAAVLTQGATGPIAQNVLTSGLANQLIPPASALTDAALRAAASSAALNLLQEAVQALPLTFANASGLMLENSQMLSLIPAVAGARSSEVDDAEMARSHGPPPPLSGALPSAQPVLPATLVSNSSTESAMHRLLADTDAAIARQTLLQVASLPGQTDTTAARLDPTAARWNFEIPFATPQGTAMAQFEISRDGGGNEVAAAKQVWRARFSLDVEPAGPVHALISFSGERTSVRMWAERPQTAAQLRAGAGQLSQALALAQLQPGDIVIRDGTPPQAAPAKAGHFLDRAL